jgi:hypothetical protein
MRRPERQAALPATTASARSGQTTFRTANDAIRATALRSDLVKKFAVIRGNWRKVRFLQIFENTITL